ncbi:MAG: hypothetical protein WAN74_06445 [Thermoplasmata archaeon]
MRPRREGGGRADRRQLVGFLVALLVVGAFVLCAEVGTTQGVPRSGGTPFGGEFAAGVSSNCSGTVLARLNATPTQADVIPLGVQMFTATTESACGTPLTQSTSFAWSLSSIALGTLNSSVGATIAYSACVAPMGGALEVKATSGGVTLYANSSISVTVQSSSTQNSTSSPPGEPLGGSQSSNLRGDLWAGLGIMAASLVAAAVILHFGRRNTK